MSQLETTQCVWISMRAYMQCHAWCISALLSTCGLNYCSTLTVSDGEFVTNDSVLKQQHRYSSATDAVIRWFYGVQNLFCSLTIWVGNTVWVFRECKATKTKLEGKYGYLTYWTLYSTLHVVYMSKTFVHF